MKASKKLLIAFFASALIATGAVMGTVGADNASAEEETAAVGYYGAALTDSVSVKLYEALCSMDFASGKSYKITDPVVTNCAAGYSRGDSRLSDCFDEAFGSFYYDRTDLFYVDHKKVSLSILGGSNGCTVEIGGGRSGSYFVNGFTAQNVPAAVQAYNTALTAMVDSVRDDLANRNLTEQNVSGNTWTYWNAYCANAAVTGNVSYSFCKDASGADTANSAHIRTAYGALINGECVCEGYSRLYKAVMDELGFKTVLIFGSATAEDGTEPHMWNAVYDETKKDWYGVDSTWNDVPGAGANKYLMVSGTVLGFNHSVNTTVSESGISLPYPELHKDEYESYSKSLTVKNVQHHFSGLESVNDGMGAGNLLCYAISYDGMNYNTAKAQNLYYAIRFRQGATVGDWCSIDGHITSMSSMGWADHIDHDDSVTYFYIPDNMGLSGVDVVVIEGPDNARKPITSAPYYTDDYVAAHTVDILSEPVPNPGYDPTYVSPSYIKSITATAATGARAAYTTTRWAQEKQDIALGKMHIVAEYTQPLRLLDGSKSADIECVVKTQKLDPRTVDLDEVWQYAKLENFSWDGSTKLSFDFTPSPMYQHNNLLYTFVPKNLVGSAGEGQIPKAPNSFGTAYAYADTYICTKCLGGGRYLIDNAYSTPVLVSDGDLSLEGWTYEKNGVTQKVSESQRSNLALVVTKPTEAVQESAQAGAQEQIQKLDLPQTAQVTSSTYEIDLNICGQIVSIPNGSYLKINLGFPEGIKYDGLDGVVFKLYHFKRKPGGALDYDNPEEIECIITPYGIVATVESFSPYTLVTIKNAPDSLVAEQAAKKGIAVMFDGVGGAVTSSTGKLTDTIAQDGSITYTFAPEEGYALEYAVLNGKAVTVTGNKVTLGYTDLESNNVLAFGFVAEAVKEAEKESGEVNIGVINLVNSQLVKSGSAPVSSVEISVNGETTTVDVISSPSSADDGDSNVLVIVLVVAGVVIAAGCAALIVFILRKKKTNK